MAPTTGGMNSATAVVELDDEGPGYKGLGDEGLFVAKWVPGGSAAALESGSRLARRLAGSGVATGDPLLTLTGMVSFPTPDGAVALLRFVSGEPLMGLTAAEQELMAITLARMHSIEVSLRSSPFMSDLLDLVHDVEPWIRSAVTEVLHEQAELPPLTWGVLHTDPAPEAFRYDPTSGQVGLIDWTGATDGPVLYDVASALMYLGGRDRATTFWTTYLAYTPAPEDELSGYIDAFSRLRAAVQAAYFSKRVATADPTGISDQQENWKGLRDAETMLNAYGIATEQHRTTPPF